MWIESERICFLRKQECSLLRRHKRRSTAVYPQVVTGARQRTSGAAYAGCRGYARTHCSLTQQNQERPSIELQLSSWPCGEPGNGEIPQSVLAVHHYSNFQPLDDKDNPAELLLGLEGDLEAFLFLGCLGGDIMSCTPLLLLVLVTLGS